MSVISTRLQGATFHITVWKVQQVISATIQKICNKMSNALHSLTHKGKHLRLIFFFSFLSKQCLFKLFKLKFCHYLNFIFHLFYSKYL